MIRIALRDLQFRRKRFVIAVLGASLVFAISLVMTGLSASFDNEVDRTLDAVGAETWIVRSDAPGPFTSFAPIGLDSLAAVRAAGVADAAPLAAFLQSAGPLDDAVMINMFGVEPGAVGSPADVDRGRPLAGPGEAVVGWGIDADLDDTIEMGGRTFTVVGRVDASQFGGQPVVFVPLVDAQAVAFGGAPAFTVVVTAQEVADAPAGLRALDRADAAEDALRPLQSAKDTITAVRTVLWVVAALIIGSVMYLNALERTRDVAVFKAIGLSTRFAAGGMALQAVVLGLASSLLAVVFGALLAPLFPMRVEVPVQGYLLLPVVAVVTALVGSVAGVRRSVTVSPVVAFGGA